jgi:hypothetical protein
MEGMEEEHPGPLPCPPLNQTISASPIAPAARHSTPQPAAPANAAPSSLPCRHRPRSLPRSPRLVLPLPTIKGPPFFPEKNPAITRNLLDIISSLVARRFELAGVGRAPERAAVPGVPASPSSRRLDVVEEEELLRRTAARRRLPSLPRRAPPPCRSQPPPPVSSL